MENREILFRGLKADGSNEWVYGYLLNTPFEKVYEYTEEPKSFIISDILYSHICYNNAKTIMTEVIPSTVGQFTGLTDNNGTRIFEGDYDSNGIMVTWCNNCNGWEFAGIDIPTKDICIPCHRCDGNFFFEDHINDFELIGNIHQK